MYLVVNGRKVKARHYDEIEIIKGVTHYDYWSFEGNDDDILEGFLWTEQIKVVHADGTIRILRDALIDPDGEIVRTDIERDCIRAAAIQYIGSLAD